MFILRMFLQLLNLKNILNLKVLILRDCLNVYNLVILNLAFLVIAKITVKTLISDYFTKTSHGLTQPSSGGSMISPGLFAGLASGAGSLIGSGINYLSQQETNKQNERLMRQQWRRENTAYQRAVSDAERAGLSKFSVSGGAGAGSLTQLTAPQIDTGSIDSAIKTGLQAQLGELNLEQGRLQNQALMLSNQHQALENQNYEVTMNRNKTGDLLDTVKLQLAQLNKKQADELNEFSIANSKALLKNSTVQAQLSEKFGAESLRLLNDPEQEWKVYTPDGSEKILSSSAVLTEITKYNMLASRNQAFTDVMSTQQDNYDFYSNRFWGNIDRGFKMVFPFLNLVPTK